MPGRKPPSVALGALPSTRAADPLSLEGTDSAIPDLMATSSQASPCLWSHQKNIPSIIQVSHSPSLPTVQKTLEVASIYPTPQSQAPPQGYSSWPVRWGALTARGDEHGLGVAARMTKATMDSHRRELVLKTDIAMCQNEAQATEAIKEAEVHCAANDQGGRGLHRHPCLCTWKNPTRKAC